MNATLLDDAELIEALAVQECRDSFWAFRQYVNSRKKKKPMKIGWFQRQFAHELQRFYDGLVAGTRPKLIIEAPPQHGKSETVVDFIAWLAGKNPDLAAIYTAFSERLGVRANLRMQRVVGGDRYRRVFPDTSIVVKGFVTEDGYQATRNRSLLEYVGYEGSFRNTTVRGSINGESLDIGVIDDPIKGREAAASETMRDGAWEWLTNDFLTRFSEEAGLLVTATRWHVDDPIGRLKKHFDESEIPYRVLSFAAIAEVDEPNRRAGEPLFPELKSLAFLLERKGVMADGDWQALYQKNPQLPGGNVIKGEWFKYYSVLPKIKYRMIYADTAQKTKEANDYSVFECWGLGADGKIYLLDLVRDKWEAPELRKQAILFWNKHKALDSNELLGTLRKMKVEDKTSGTGLVQEIKRAGKFPIEGIERSIDKYTRALDGLGYIENGFVVLPIDAAFTHDFVKECKDFTANDSHLFDDQIDPMLDAIKDLLAGSVSIYDTL